MWKFRSLKGRDRWLFLLTLGVILCILAFPAGRLGSQAPGKAEAGAKQAEEAAGGFPLPQTQEAENTQGKQEPQGGQAALEAAGLAAASGLSYEQQLEQRVKEILSHVDGVGAVDVMIVLKSSSEKVLRSDRSWIQSRTEETDASGGSRRTENQEQTDTAVILSGEEGSQPVVEKELYPELSGVVISAQGGGSARVRSEISAAMEALFGLPAHKIKILKRVE